MKTLTNLLCTAVLGCAGALTAQDTDPNRIVLKYSDPSRPGTLSGSLMFGGFKVIGHDSDEIVIELADVEEKESRDGAHEENRGLQRIPAGGASFTVEEFNNHVEIQTEISSSLSHFVVKVPRRTSLRLRCLNEGLIHVQGLSGEFDVENLNGEVVLEDVSGSVVAHALNGDVRVHFKDVAPDKPMSFTTVHGDVDVTLPGDVKADLKLDSQQGEIYSAFDIDLRRKTTKGEGQRGESGRYRIHFERTLLGKLNGGGSVFTFKTMAGNIYLRRADP